MATSDRNVSTDQWPKLLENRDYDLGPRQEGKPSPGFLKVPPSIADWNFDFLASAGDSNIFRAPVTNTVQKPSLPSVMPPMPVKSSVPSTSFASSTPVVLDRQVADRGNHVGRVKSDDNPELNVGSDIEAIQDTCLYVRKIVQNFNAHLENLPEKTQKLVSDLNKSLTEICKSTTPDQDSDDSEASSDYVPDPVRKVRFRDGVQDTCPRSTTTKREVAGVKKFSKGKAMEGSSEPHFSSRPDDVRLPQDQNLLSMTQMMQVLSRLDTRTVPKPENFDLSSGQRFTEFLLIFEEYCGNTFRGSSARWIGELGRFLTGDVKVAMEAIKVPGETYETLKHKLTRWVESRAELLKVDCKARFRDAVMKPGESLTLCAARLENLFQQAYPSRSVEGNATLRTKYFSIVPDQIRSQLINARTMTKTMTGSELTWSQIIAYVSQYEIDYKPKITDTDGEIWVTHSGSVSDQEKKVDFSGSKPQVVDLCPQSSSGNQNGQHNLEQPRRPRGDDRPVYRGRGSDVLCSYCKKGYHHRKDCWYMLQLCLVCGSEYHSIAQCPDLRVNKRGERRSQGDQNHQNGSGESSRPYNGSRESQSTMSGCKPKDHDRYPAARRLN